MAGLSLVHKKFNRQLPLVLGIAKGKAVQKQISQWLKQIAVSID